MDSHRAGRHRSASLDMHVDPDLLAPAYVTMSVEAEFYNYSSARCRDVLSEDAGEVRQARDTALREPLPGAQPVAPGNALVRAASVDTRFQHQVGILGLRQALRMKQ